MTREGAALLSFLLMRRSVAYPLHRIVAALDRHSAASQLCIFLPEIAMCLMLIYLLLLLVPVYLS